MPEDVDLNTTNAVQLVSNAKLFPFLLCTKFDFKFLAEFRYAGQNIAWRGNTAEYEKLQDSIREMIKTWFVEYKDADMSYIHAYRDHDQG